MDSALGTKLKAHLNYHEQASSFSACGYAQATGKTGVAYANVGPGATNLLTGIANAWFDSISTIFIAGQVETAALKGEYKIRQRGIQETHSAEIFRSVTKYSVLVDSPEKLRYALERAYYEVTTGRPGPAYIEIPADIQRMDIDVMSLPGFFPEATPVCDLSTAISTIITELGKAKRPCLLVGNGIKQSRQYDQFCTLTEKLGIPIVFSLPAFDLLTSDHPLNFGYIGTNGNRYSNFILGKSDLIISIGSRMDLKQVGTNRANFALNAKIIRMDVDTGELGYKVRSDELSFVADLKDLFKELNPRITSKLADWREWIGVCENLRMRLTGYDFTPCHHLLRELSKRVAEDSIVTLDVGQHTIYAIQSLIVKKGQKVLVSTGLGSMGYSIPAAIGAYFATKTSGYVICGDGGFQMNMQELQFISREKLPIKVIVVNNNSLGMVREFQERNFSNKTVQTTKEYGYTVPDLRKVATVYGFDYYRILTIDDVKLVDLTSKNPAIIEMVVEEDMYLNPRLNSARPVQDMNPPMERSLYNELMEL